MKTVTLRTLDHGDLVEVEIPESEPGVVIWGMRFFVLQMGEYVETRVYTVPPKKLVGNDDSGRR